MCTLNGINSIFKKKWTFRLLYNIEQNVLFKKLILKILKRPEKTDGLNDDAIEFNPKNSIK